MKVSVKYIHYLNFSLADPRDKTRKRIDRVTVSFLVRMCDYNIDIFVAIFNICEIKSAKLNIHVCQLHTCHKHCST